jgi:MFS family permease
MNSPHRFYKWELVILFWFAYFLNQGDRQIFNAVLPLIKADLCVDDVHLGLVATTFTLVYGLLVPIAGCLGDFLSRKWIVVLSLLVFSTGTLLTGLAGGLVGLVLFRSLTTGGGEACYYPAATALLGHYHPTTRAQAMGLHQTALYVGIVVSSWLAAFVGERYGWRASFYTFGFIGLLLAIVLMWRMHNDRGETIATEPAPRLREVLAIVLRTPTFYCLSLAFGGMVFVNTGWMTWMPTYLVEHFHRPLQEANLCAMLSHYLFAFFGVIAGGRIADRLAPRRPAIRIEIKALGLLLGAPFIALLGFAPSAVLVYVALAGFGLFRGLYDSNLFAALYDVVPPRCRSSATGLMLCYGFTTGAFAPVVLGYVKKHVSLSLGLSSLAVLYLLSAAIIWLARQKFFAKDYAHVV